MGLSSLVFGQNVQPFLLYYGGGAPLSQADVPSLARFSLLDVDRFRFTQISWQALKALNPNLKVYLYEDGPDIRTEQDGLPPLSLNTISRYGILNLNHPELFLLDQNNIRIFATSFSNPSASQFDYLMDFGSSVYQAFWLDAVKSDIINQPWVADGVFVDDCVAKTSQVGYSATPAKYPTDQAFSLGMNSFVASISSGLHNLGQRLWCNKGESRSQVGSQAWITLDQSASPPDLFLEEGAFAVMWGGSAVQFLQEAEWKQQIDTFLALKNTKAALLSHTQLTEGTSGVDNFGNPCTFWQVLWYSLGSYLLVNSGNTFFSFHGGDSDYNKIIWYNEYDHIDLGKPLGPLALKVLSGVNIYQREFEKGFVFVNPTSNPVTVSLPNVGRQLTHDNILQSVTSLPFTTSFLLGGHSSGIILKLPAPLNLTVK